jgi:hypothetical protein
MSEIEQRGREIKKLELEIGSDMEAIGKLLTQVQELFPNNHADNTPSYANVFRKQSISFIIPGTIGTRNCLKI